MSHLELAISSSIPSAASDREQGDSSALRTGGSKWGDHALRFSGAWRYDMRHARLKGELGRNRHWRLEAGGRLLHEAATLIQGSGFRVQGAGCEIGEKAAATSTKLWRMRALKQIVGQRA